MNSMFSKYKEIAAYLVFGVLTTAVNIAVYYTADNILHINYLISNAMAWFLSVLFAYITNRRYVFDSKDNHIFYEAIKFFLSRVSTGVMDMILMWLLVSYTPINDMIIKIFVNVLVVVLNYVLSKILVFR